MLVSPSTSNPTEVYLYVGGSQHGKEYATPVDQEATAFMKPVEIKWVPDFDLDQSIQPADAVEIYYKDMLGNIDSGNIKEVFVVERISKTKAMELLKEILLEGFINGRVFS